MDLVGRWPVPFAWLFRLAVLAVLALPAAAPWLGAETAWRFYAVGLFVALSLRGVAGRAAKRA